MTEPYPCPKCRETLYKSENRLSKGGYMIPVNFYDGEISKRGEDHRCPKDSYQRQKPEPVNQGSGMHEYMRRHAKLEGKDWVLYIDERRTGLVVDREVT